MKKAMLLGCAAALFAIGAAKAAPVDLSTYVDVNGFIDVQALTCGQRKHIPGRRQRAHGLVQRMVQRPRPQALPRLQEGP